MLRLRIDNNKVTVQTALEKGIPLTVGDSTDVVYRLKFLALCTWSEDQKFVGIKLSRVTLVVEDVAEPVLRLQYVKDADRDPVSHFHLHSHHPGLMGAMSQGKKGSRAVKHSPRTEVIHMPTGGHRFRPTIEDIMQMLVNDFGINAAEGWREELEEGRAIFKESQLSAAISDNPGRAADALREMGYDVKWHHDSPEPSLREHRLKHF